VIRAAPEVPPEAGGINARSWPRTACAAAGRRCRSRGRPGSAPSAPRCQPEVSLIAFFFASNHFHLILSASSSAAVSAFTGHLESNVARLANQLHGWRGPLWEWRFPAIPILDDESALAKLRYLLSHGCKEGLKPEEAYIRYPIPLSPLPCWAELSEEERRAKVRAMVADIEAETRKKHEDEGTRPMGVRRVLAQHPHARPKEVKRTRAPSCHAASAALRKGFRAVYRAFASAFRVASDRLRAGDRSAVFPEHCFPPALASQGAGPP